MLRICKPQQVERRIRLIGLLSVLVLGAICMSAVAYPALSAPIGPLAGAFSDDAEFSPMTKEEMSKQRGGYDGVAFGIFLSGTLNQPITTTLPAGLTVSALDPNQVQIIGAIGNIGSASGIFQFTNIVGNMNVVNNNIIINVSIQSTSPTNAVGLP
jgi:hypothetical protein